MGAGAPDRIPAAVRGGDRGIRPPARRSRAAPRGDRARWRDMRHACRRAVARAHPHYRRSAPPPTQQL